MKCKESRIEFLKGEVHDTMIKLKKKSREEMDNFGEDLSYHV